MEQMGKLVGSITDHHRSDLACQRVQMENEEAARVRTAGFPYLCALLVLPLLLAGCWDRVEIQDRLMVMAVAIDKSKPEKGKRSYYEFTAQLSEPRALSTRVSNPNIQPVWNATSTGPSIFECVRLLATRVARQPYYEHLQIIVIGEELAKEGIDQPLDLFYRDHESRRKIKLVIAKGSAKDALKVKPKLLPLSGRYLSMLTEEGESKTARLPKTGTIGQFSSNYHNGANSVLPAIRIEPTEVKMAGGAIIRGDRLVGWLDDQDVKAFRWINGTFSAGDEIIFEEQKKGGSPKFTTLEVKGARSTIKTSIQNGKPVFTLSIRGEGNVAEDGLGRDPTLAKIKEKEKKINKVIKANTEALISLMQKKYQTDIFGFGEELRRHHYSYWKTHKKDWDRIFKEAEVRVDVQTFIRRIGQFK
jgi:Ger(x)C family germination protein